MHIADFESSKKRQLFQRPRLAPVIETLKVQGYWHSHSHGHRPSILSTELEFGGRCFHRRGDQRELHIVTVSCTSLSRPVTVLSQLSRLKFGITTLTCSSTCMYTCIYAQPVTQISTPLLHHYNTLNIWGIRYSQSKLCRLSCSSSFMQKYL